MKQPTFILTALALITLSIYLFVSAPPPLPDSKKSSGKILPMRLFLLWCIAMFNIQNRASIGEHSKYFFELKDQNKL